MATKAGPLLFVIDDERDILQLLASNLTVEFPDAQIKTYIDAESCLTQVKQGNLPDVLITDLKMDGINGLELIKNILESTHNVSIIVNTAYGDALLDSASELGIQEIVDKLGGAQGVIDAVRNAIATRQLLHKDFLQVALGKLMRYKRYPFDLFVRLNNNKFVCVFKKHDEVVKEKLERFKQKGVKSFYVKKREYLQFEQNFYMPFKLKTLAENSIVEFPLFVKKQEGYRELIAANTKIESKHLELLNKHKVNKLFLRDCDENKYHSYMEGVIDTVKEDKGKLIGELAISKVTKALDNPTSENLGQLEKVVKMVDDFILDSDESRVKKLLGDINKSSIYQHSLRVATLNVAILDEILKMRRDSKQQAKIKVFDQMVHDGKDMRSTLILSGLLHDIGKISLQIDSSIDPQTLSEEEKQRYFSHVAVGVEYLEKKAKLPAKIYEIVAQHEEFIDGSGKPNGLMKKDMSIFAQIISLTNFYDRLSVQGQPHDAIVEIEMSERKFNQYLVYVLKRVVLPEKWAT